MKPFIFFKGHIYSDEYTLPVARRMSGRTFAQDLIPVQPMEEPRGNIFYMDTHPNRLRWIEAHTNGFHYRIYTHYVQSEVERIVLQTILPFLYEPNNPNNRQRLLDMLSARFHSAQLLG